MLNEYDNRIKYFQQQMGEKRSQTKVSVVMFWDGVRIYMKKSFSGGILSDLGLPRPPEQDKDKVAEDISLELIPKMAGDAIFLMIGDRTPELERFTNHPLWSQLEAVKQGKVYKVKADTWLAGYSPVAANSVLDDLFKYLVKKSDTS
jgi:iron complex transport system substrate-binding protein